jgi:hypothetical protein
LRNRQQQPLSFGAAHRASHGAAAGGLLLLLGVALTTI